MAWSGDAGAGGALAAAEAGARVLLLERDAALPSTFAVSGGLFSAAGTRWQAEAGVADSPALFAADIAVNPELVGNPDRIAASISGASRSAWARAAISGTTPP